MNKTEYGLGLKSCLGIHVGKETQRRDGSLGGTDIRV